MFKRFAILGIMALLSDGVLADAPGTSVSQAHSSGDTLLADTRGQDRREDRGDNREDREDCREEEGRVGKDKRDCKRDDGDDDA